ncbi:MAG TPA: DUF3037 domain-containing protein [Chitinophagaceae bacterium]
MQDRELYEYAVIRLVPRVDREEFLNVGIILFCKKQGYLKCKYELDRNKLQHVFPELELDEAEAHLESFRKICDGSPDSGPIGQLDLPSRFRWLTAKRSTIVQTSQTHPGLCTDMDKNLEHLFETLVK